MQVRIPFVVASLPADADTGFQEGDGRPVGQELCQRAPASTGHQMPTGRYEPAPVLERPAEPADATGPGTPSAGRCPFYGGEETTCYLSHLAELSSGLAEHVKHYYCTRRFTECIRFVQMKATGVHPGQIPLNPWDRESKPLPVPHQDRRHMST